MIQALLVAVVAFLASIDEQTFGACMMSRPLFTGPIVGLIMGDVTTGIIIGASLEAMFMGSIMVGSAVIPSLCVKCSCIAVAIQSGTGVGTAVALALPLSIFLQMWRNFCYAIPGSWAGKQIEKAVNERNIKKANLFAFDSEFVINWNSIGIRKIYPNDDDYYAALKRHTETFNITPHVSPFLMGLGVAMEERNAKSEDFDAESVNNVKVGLMGPLSESVIPFLGNISSDCSRNRNRYRAERKYLGSVGLLPYLYGYSFYYKDSCR